MFDRRDYATGVVAALLSFAVYLFTAAPSVTLLDSGEFITAGQQFGVPHPTGYPLWTMLAWLIHLLPFGNAAWKINVLSGVLGALAVGLSAMLCRSSLRWMFPEAAERWRGLGTLAALSGALLFAFSLSMWSQAVIAEIYTLHALLVGGILTAMYAWIRRPQSLMLLLLTFFLLALAFSNHQLTLALAPLPFLAVAMIRRRIFWSLVVASLLTAELFYLALAILSGEPQVLKASIRLFYVLAIVTGIYVFGSGNRVRWRLIALLAAAVALGLLPYAYLPFASSTNPPMNWGCASEAKGFFYSFNRSQYSGSLTSQSLRVLGPLMGVAQPKLPASPEAPKNTFQPEDQAPLPWLQDWVAFFSWQLMRSFTPLSALALACAAAVLFLVRDHRARTWLAVLFAAFALAALLQPFLDKAGDDVNGWWLQMPYHSYTNLIFGLLCGIGFFRGLSAMFARFPRLRWTQYGLLLLPLVPLFGNFDIASQRDRWFGWQFGHDMLNDLPPGSVVIGGTDAGRFVPTYMIFGESPQPPDRKLDPDFDRRDLYIITQNALGDPFYMQYLSDQYSSSRRPVKTAFERWLGRETIYPEQPLILPAPTDVKKAVAAALAPDPVTGKRTGGEPMFLVFSATLKWIWNQNRGAHRFFVEESFPMDWTYDYAIPHGLVYELSATKLEKLPDDAVARDFTFWADYKSRLLSNPLFGSDFDARRSFSKLRTTGGNIYRHWKMFPEAERAYEEALDLWPGEGNALSALMQVQWQRGEFDAIQKRIEQARLDDPRNEAWKKLATYAEQRKSLQSGIEAGEARVAKEPKNRDAWIRLVTLLTQAGESGRAAGHVASGLRELPEDPEYLRFAATYFQLSDHPGRSLEPAKKLTEIEPAIPANFYLLARAWYLETNRPAFYEAAGKAIVLGGIATRTMIAQDPGFSALHGEPEFQNLIHPAPPSAR